VKTFGQRRRSCPGIKIMHYDRGIAVAILAKTDCLDARHMTEPESARFLFGVGQIVGRVAHTTSQSLGVETPEEGTRSCGGLLRGQRLS
jgi:hypothetical protein